MLKRNMKSIKTKLKILITMLKKRFRLRLHNLKKEQKTQLVILKIMFKIAQRIFKKV